MFILLICSIDKKSLLEPELYSKSEGTFFPFSPELSVKKSFFLSSALGDGIKAVTPGEVPIREKLRRIQ